MSPSPTEFIDLLETGQTTPLQISEAVREQLSAIRVSEGFGGVVRAYCLLRDQPKPIDGWLDDFCQRALAALTRLSRRELPQGDLRAAASLGTDRQLVDHVLNLANVYFSAEPRPSPFTVEWICQNHPTLFRSISQLCGGDWSYVQDLLDPSIVLVVNSDHRKPLSDLDLGRRITDLRPIAEGLGDLALAQVLISLGVVGDRDVPALRQLVTQHLGKCTPREGFSFSQFALLPPSSLRDPDVYRVVFVHLRDHVYRRIMDSDVAGTEASQKNIFEIIQREANGLFDLKIPEHQRMFNDLVLYWQTVLSIQGGEAMKDTVTDEAGRLHPFPSLRQKVAVHEIIREGRQINATLMGRGKTASPFLAWENLKAVNAVSSAQKLVMICPPNMVPHMIGRVSKYYKDGAAPSISTITNELQSRGDLLQATDAEIIIVADTMLGSKRKDREGELSVLDALKALKIGYLCVDEAHRARNVASKKAGRLQELVQGDAIPYVQLLTASPIPNRITDVLTYLKLLYPKDYETVQQVQNVDPLRLRNTLLRCLIALDPSENWRQEISYSFYSLNPAERVAYETIRGIRELSVMEKMRLLRRFLLNPSYHHPSIESGEGYALLNSVTAKIREAFEDGEKTVLVAHPNLVDGFTQSTAPQTGSWLDELQARFPGVGLEVIDGKVGDEERTRILYTPPSKQRVILANANTIREGVSLVHIKRAILIDPDFNNPDTHQLLRRFNRSGSMGCEFTVMVGEDTLSRVIFELACMKEELCHLVLYGGNLTEDHLKEMADLDLDLENLETIDISFNDRAARIATLILQELLVGGAYAERFLRYFHAKGEESLAKVVKQNGAEIATRILKDHPFSYVGNNARLVAGLIQSLERDALIPTGGAYVDFYSGPCSLATSFPSDRSGPSVFSVDPNEALLKGGQTWATQTGLSIPDEKMLVGGYDALKHFGPSSIACAHLGLSFNILTLQEKRRTLQALYQKMSPSGIVVITLPIHTGTDKERAKLQTDLSEFGFQVLEDWSGLGTAGSTSSNYFENFTLVCRKTNPILRPKSEQAKLALSLRGQRALASEALYATHDSFKVGTRAIEVPETQILEFARLKRITELQDLLNGLLAQGSLTSNDIPPQFADLGAYILAIGDKTYLGIPSSGGSFHTFLLQKPSDKEAQNV